MNPRGLQVVTLIIVLGAALVANPPPGELFGREVPLIVWAGVLLLGLLGAIASIMWAGGPAGYVGVGLMALPLMGPVHGFAEAGFLALLAGAWALGLHLELTTFQARRARWASLLGDQEGQEALETYQRAYVRALRRLAGITLGGLGLLTGAYWLLREVAPGTFSLSIEASHVEGMAAFTLLLILFIAATWLLTRRTPETPEPAAPETEGTL